MVNAAQNKKRYRVLVAVTVEVDAGYPHEAGKWAHLALGLRNSISHRYHDDLAETVPFKSAATGEDVVTNAVALNADVLMGYEVDPAEATPYGHEGEQFDNRKESGK